MQMVLQMKHADGRKDFPIHFHVVLRLGASGIFALLENKKRNHVLRVKMYPSF
jgi:hypothetical protein